MGTRAIAQGDKITGICPNHLVPSGSGTAPAGPLDFSAPITQGTVSTVLIGGKPAAVMGASGYNEKVHAGIVDGAFAAANMQVGRILSGSATVLMGGKPAATLVSSCTCCVVPGKLGPGAASVLIG